MSDSNDHLLNEFVFAPLRATAEANAGRSLPDHGWSAFS